MEFFNLNETEQATLKKWVNNRGRKKLLSTGGRLLLEFGQSVIGRYVFAMIVVDVPGGETDAVVVASTDVTDYEAW